jgi:hypothetical protein
MRAAGDLDGDGHGDFLLAEPLADRGSRSTGVVRVISGADGSTLREHVGSTKYESLGWDACDLGDIDGDGTHDYALSTHSGTYEMRIESFVLVYSGRDGKRLREIREPGLSDDIRMEPTGDVDGDGINDLLIRGATFNAERDRKGWVIALVSGKEGNTLWRRSFKEFFHYESVGDVDGDGVPDFWTGGWGP